MKIRLLNGKIFPRIRSQVLDLQTRKNDFIIVFLFISLSIPIYLEYKIYNDNYFDNTGGKIQSLFQIKRLFSCIFYFLVWNTDGSTICREKI